MENNILKRNENNDIICVNHNMEGLICLEENCKHQINCFLCILNDKHDTNHSKKNIEIKALLNKQIADNLFDENLLNIDEKINSIRLEIESLKKFFISEIESKKKLLMKTMEELEIKLIEKLKNNNIDFEKITIKENYLDKLKEFNKENNNFVKLFDLAKEFFKLATNKNLTSTSNSIENLKQINNIIKSKKNHYLDSFDLNSNKFTSHLFSYSFDISNSKIIKNIEQSYKFIDELFTTKTIIKSDLIYSGLDDNFSLQNYRTKCHDQTNLFYLLKSEQDKIFGAFHSISFNDSKGNNSFWPDKHAFIFSYENKQSFRCKDPNKAIRYFSGRMIVFGGGSNGSDIAIFDKCNINKSSYTNFGASYEIPTNLVHNTPEAKSYLTGSYKFSLKAMEVFKLKFK